MKKILALLLALSALFVLSACDKDEEGTPAGGEAHTHSYSSEVTTAATCTENGVKTFTCTCGDSYTEDIASTGHTWGKSEIISYALVGKPGEEKRTCSVCSESETKERTDNAISNSFYDGGLQYIVANNYGSISGSSLLNYACHELHEYLHKPVASSTIIAALSQRFNVTASMKNEMIDLGKSLAQYGGGTYGYNEADDTFNLQYMAEMSNFNLLGYVHKSGNQYTAYYSFAPFDIDAEVMFKVELEYNKINDKPNKYLSVEKVNDLPGNMIECPTGERSEFIG